LTRAVPPAPQAHERMRAVADALQAARASAQAQAAFIAHRALLAHGHASLRAALIAREKLLAQAS